MTWYVVCSDMTAYEHGEERDQASVWTVSTRPDETGWQTDSGFPGYGMIRSRAQFLADAANEKETRDGRGPQVSP